MNAKAQRGSALLETILLLPVLIGITLLAADLYILHQARSYLEQSAHNVASVIGAQGRLDANGLRALIEQAASTQVLHNYEMIISKVENDRSMQWRPLHRGPAQGLCTAYSEGNRYTGELPEALPDPEDEDTGTRTSLIVVQVCRSSEDLALSDALIGGATLEAMAISRLQHGTPSLDAALTRELDPQETP
ncbi:TadE/TadG family type IV pilus assembly protein [Pseudomonas aegrilactucae]|uniref:Pilus assembly protein n=1 Tax=Pseudomonas aegrilactucae TaxID=2854028 RepID=A0A9Q2XIX5_9PSED|nr:TadE family protein [Pseudomonas aegrilactucae]MBV6287887.1 pilus assembly protein [Pseudomonas aegrilactucae]